MAAIDSMAAHVACPRLPDLGDTAVPPALRTPQRQQRCNDFASGGTVGLVELTIASDAATVILARAVDHCRSAKRLAIIRKRFRSARAGRSAPRLQRMLEQIIRVLAD